MLAKILEKNGYVKLVFDKPEISQFVIIPFTVQDDNPKRKDRESELELRKIINKTLEKTNWRPMSEGMTYRLGYLYGRLKGYEKEDDLIKLI